MIWIIGANGMLGSQLCSTLSENKIDFVGTDRNVDITDFDSLKDFSGGKKITAIVNCAAYTAVDNAENDVELAQQKRTEKRPFRKKPRIFTFLERRGFTDSTEKILSTR